MSLVEILLAIVIAALASVSIFRTLKVSRDQYMQVDILVTGDLLAQSVMEQAIHAFDLEDSRFFTLSSQPTEIKQGIAEKRWQEPFLQLTQAKTPIITAVGVPNPYFDPTFGPALPLTAGDGAVQRFLKDFSYQVDVSFDRITNPGDTPAPLDSDGDGKPDVDAARLVVTIFHEPGGERNADPIVAQHSTFLGVPDKVPGVRP